ncbi:MAG: MFS transporter [Deltaproteobacteria bacterium]|nr:MAG: MFS transporter [Deltaproteobacteria bacterium]
MGSVGLLPCFVVAHFVHHLLTALPIPLLPLIRSDYALDYTLSGWVVSAFNLAYGIGQLPAGWLADRIGPRIIITVGICGVALAGLFVGLSQSFGMLLFFLALMGFLGGGYHPASPPLIAASVEAKTRGRALGLHTIGGGASYFLAPIIGTAIAVYWGWRGSFIWLAGPTIIFGLLFYFILRRHGNSQAAGVKASSSPAMDAPPEDSNRNLAIFIFLSTFTGAVIFATISFIPLFLVDHFGFAKERAGAFFALIYSAGLWVSPIGGYLSDRWGRIPLILGVCFFAGPVIFALPFAPGQWGVLTLLLLIGVIIYVRMPVSESYIIRHTSPHNRSTILGLYFFGSMEGGGILTPVAGYLIDHYGFAVSFTISGALLLAVTFICSLLLRGSRD